MRKIKLTEKEYNAILNQSYIEGYKAGYHAGMVDSILKNITVNQLRAFTGLPPIEKEVWVNE